jgi:hypothetical protein
MLPSPNRLLDGFMSSSRGIIFYKTPIFDNCQRRLSMRVLDFSVNLSMA